MLLDKTWQRLLDNVLPSCRLTLIHGDALGNILYPRDPDRDEAILMDWQSHGVGVGVDDLAFFLIKSMASSHRQRVEPTLLAHYYEQLWWHGVSDYSWEQFEEDYRLAVIRFLSFEIFYYSGWEADWTDLDRAFAAFEYLECANLL